MAPILPILGLLGGGVALNELKKAGQNREIKNILEKLGSPTGGFGYQTGFGPFMMGPTSGYQAIDAYNRQMGKTQRENMIANIAAIEPFTDRAKRRDFERNMAAARFRTQLGTHQGLTLQGQRGAQALAQQGMQGAMSALGSNSQYQ